MECKFCNAPIPEDSTVCPECGKEQEQLLTVQEELPVIEEETAAEEVLSEEEAAAAEVAAEEEVAAEAPAAKSKLWVRVTAIVCCVVVVLGLAAGIWYNVNGGFAPRKNDLYYRDSYLVSDSKAVSDGDAVVATAGDYTLTNKQFQVYYWMAVYSFLDNYGSYLSYFNLDLTKPLGEQYVSEGGDTWEQYFISEALNNWHGYQCMGILADQAGMQTSAAVEEQIAITVTSMEATAKQYQFASADEMIQGDMGPGADLEAYCDYMRIYLRGMEYFEHLYNQFQPTQEEVEHFYNVNGDTIEENYHVNKETGKVVDVRHILLYPQGGTEDDTGNVTYSEAEWEACRIRAEALLRTWKAGEATESSFAAMANAKSEDPGSNAAGGLYTDVYDGQMVEPFNDWCFDESRQSGDTGVVRTSFGYHVMYYVGGEEGWLRYSRQELISTKCSEIMQQGIEENPLAVDFKTLVIGNVKLTN
jgi:hypothetical protein